MNLRRTKTAPLVAHSIMANANRLIEIFNEAKARPAGPERERFLAEARAEVLDRGGDPDGALAALEKGIALVPTNPALWVATGRMLQQVNRVDEALHALSKAIELSNADTNTHGKTVTEARLERSSVLRSMNRLEEASADRLAALGIAPRNPRLTRNSIDLSPFYNCELRSILRMAADIQTDLDFHQEVQRNTGVPFDLRGLVTLGGKVGDEHFPLVEKQPTLLSFKDWWRWKTEVKTGAQPAWAWEKHDYPFKGPVRLYQMTRDNPHPETEIKSLDFVSAMTACAPFLIVITVE